jgi:membrane-associated phospholipid phosphatase
MCNTLSECVVSAKWLRMAMPWGSPDGSPGVSADFGGVLAVAARAGRQLKPVADQPCDNEPPVTEAEVATSAGPSRPVARWVSIAGHPLVLVPAAVLVAGSHHLPWSTTAAIFAVVGLALAVLAVYVRRGVRAGRFSNVDVSERQQRGASYRAALLVTAGMFVTLRVMGQGGGGPLGALVVLGASALINRALKVSQHVAFAVFAAGLVGPELPIWFAAFLVAAAAVAWSRIALRRHSWLEVTVGAALGTVGALIARAFF